MREISTPVAKLAYRFGVALILIVAAGCGGGDGGGGGGAPPPSPLTFAMPGPIDKTYGDAPFTNAASGGKGSITYSSNATAVATVAASTGAVTITGAGDATITAADSSSQKSYSLVVAKAAQSVTVSGTAAVDAVVGASWSVSIATNVGPGALSFSSDAATTVSVDAMTGALQALAPGSAKISIVKAGDANHAAAQASFTVNAVAPMIQALNVWVGTADSLVTASPAAPSLNFYRSTSSSCVLANYSGCPNGQFDLLVGSAVTDTALNLTSTAYYWAPFYIVTVARPAPANL